jgi:hypothetical protein
MPDQPPQDIFAGCPEWLRIAIVALIAAAALWIFARVLKWALSLMAIVVLVGGIGFAAWLLLH